VNIIINNREKPTSRWMNYSMILLRTFAFVWDTHYLKRTQPSSYWW